MRNRYKGFTLIELMIVVAIIAILAAIAYPSYTEQVRSSRRGDAQGALAGLANAMERYFTENGTYTAAATGGANTGSPLPTVYPSEAPLDGNTKFYDLTITAATATSYTIQATPKGGQTGDRCGNLTLTSTGARGAAQADCWR